MSMSPGALLLSVAIAQNVVLVHFLAPWPYPVLVTSVRRSVYLSVGIAAALVWVSVLFALVYRFVLVPASLQVLSTLLLITILALSYLFWKRIAHFVAPFHSQSISRAMPIFFLNTTSFVVPMALGETLEVFSHIPLAAAAAGVGFFVAVVPVAAVYEHMSTAPVPRALRGNVSILLATAIFALAIRQLDILFASFAYPIW